MAGHYKPDAELRECGKCSVRPFHQLHRLADRQLRLHERVMRNYDGHEIARGLVQRFGNQLQLRGADRSMVGPRLSPS